MKDSRRRARCSCSRFSPIGWPGCCATKALAPQEIDAVLAEPSLRIDLVPKRLVAVRAFMELPEATSLAAANKRIGNILKKADDVPDGFDRGIAARAVPSRRSAAAFARLRPGPRRCMRRATTRPCCARWRR